MASPAALLACVLAPLLPAPLVQGDDPAPAQDDGAESRAAWQARAIGGWLTLPEDPYGRVFAAIGRETVPVPVGAGALAALDPAAAEDPAVWARWAATLARLGQAARANELPAPADLTLLALVAAGQGRAEDAWRWLSAHGPGAPEHVAGILAYFVPGVPPGTALGLGGKPASLAAGARLAPLPPPKPAGTPEWQIAWREAEFKGLVVGDAEVDGRVAVEGSGSEVRLTHVRGDAVAVQVELAPEAGYEFGGRYLDWEPRAEGLPSAATIEVTPGGEEHVYWGRFVERREQRPASPRPGALPAQLSLGGLSLALDAVDPRRALAEGIARELATLLGIPVSVGTRGGPPRASAGVSSPVVVDVPPGDAGQRTLAALAGQVERWLQPMAP